MDISLQCVSAADPWENMGSWLGERGKIRGGEEMHRCKAGELYSFIFAKEEKMGVRIISLFRFEFIVTIHANEW